jgi:hypothetical protein
MNSHVHTRRQTKHARLLQQNRNEIGVIIYRERGVPNAANLVIAYDLPAFFGKSSTWGWMKTLGRRLVAITDQLIQHNC